MIFFFTFVRISRGMRGRAGGCFVILRSGHGSESINGSGEVSE